MPEVQKLRDDSLAEEVTFPMCEVGHESQKLTTLLVTPSLFKPLEFLNYMRCSHATHRAVGGSKIDGQFSSARSSRYPARLNDILAQAIAEPNYQWCSDLQLERGPDDPDWILGWEVRRDTQGRVYRTAIVDSDLLSFP